MTLNIVNVVSNFSVEKHLDLLTVARTLWNVEYNPSKFGAVVIRQKNPYCTFLLFNNGKFVCCGTKSVVECFWACKKLVKKIRKLLQLPLKMKNFKVENVVATFSLQKNLNLIYIKELWQNGFFNFNNVKSCYFEPELFSALQFRFPHRSILIFNSGKIILTGYLCKTELHSIYFYLKQNL